MMILIMVLFAKNSKMEKITFQKSLVELKYEVQIPIYNDYYSLILKYDQLVNKPLTLLTIRGLDVLLKIN